MTCRTPEDAAAAGWEAAADAPPLTEAQVIEAWRLLGRDTAPAEAPAA